MTTETELLKPADARMLRHFADQIEKGEKVCWFWIAVKYPNATMRVATKHAPNRPGGM